jgi:hypothetical protein
MGRAAKSIGFAASSPRECAFVGARFLDYIAAMNDCFAALQRRGMG